MSGAPTFGDAVLRIAPDQIQIPERLGLYFPDKAAALGRMMAVNGQRTPLTVRKSGPRAALPWTLVVGRHRLGGALLEVLPTVMAIEVSHADADEVMDIEASENVHRREQPPLERAIFIHAVCEAAKARIAREHGDLTERQLGAKARWDRVRSGAVRAEQVLQEESDDASDKLSLAYGWLESAAEAFGLGKRDIQRALRLYRLVIEPFPALTQALSDHPVVGNNASELKRIAEVQDEMQRRLVIERLLGDNELSADGARELVGIDAAKGPEPTDAKIKFKNAIIGNWGRLSGHANAFIPVFVKVLSESQLKTMKRAVDAELGETVTLAPVEPKLRVGVQQASDVLASTIGTLNRLLEGAPVDDDELAELRKAAQGVVFDIPAATEVETSAPLAWPGKTHAQG